MDHIQQNKIKAIVISVDAEKAFDSVNWNVPLQSFTYMYSASIIQLLKPYRHSMTILLLGLKSTDIYQIVLP